MADNRPIRVEVAIVLPTGERLTKALTAETEWRQELDLPLREYVALLLHRVTAEAHRWVAATVPGEEPPARGNFSGPTTEPAVDPPALDRQPLGPGVAKGD